MSLRSLILLVFTVFSMTLLAVPASAQGGWRQWEIHFLDGTVLEANPLQITNAGRFTRSMSPHETGFERSKIDYIAASTKQLPPAPTGKVKQDLIVMLDGKRTFGNLTFKKLEFSEGTIVQNGREMTLENVAYIKFAHPTTKPKKTGKG